ncbi:MAG: thiol reductant ABC exporter subunit CydD [Anaerolineales bacterium]
MFPDSRLLKLAQKSRPWLILTIGLGFASGLLTILQARYISRLVSRVFLDGAGLSQTANLLAGILVAFSLRSILAWGSNLSGKTIAVQVKTRVQTLLLEKLGELGPAYLGEQQSGEISSTVVDGVESLDAYFSQYLPQLALSALVPLSILLFVFPMDALSGAVLLVTAPLIPYFMFLIGSSAKKITDRQYSIMSRLAAQFLDSLQGLRTLRLFNQAAAQTEQIRASSDEYRQTTMKVLQVTFLSALVLELLATLSTAVVAVQIGLRLLYFRVSLEQALFILIIAPEFYIPLRMLGTRFHAGMEGQTAAERIFQILGARSSSRQGQDLAPAPPLETIQFKDVHFSYPGNRGQAIKGIDLTVERGQQIALVGSSGAGKSTLASLLLGFFSPSQGEITLNGRNLSELDPASWRASIAWVPQRPAIFQDTIAANIRLARPDADDGAVAAAAAAAHLADFIEALPQGYNTVIGEGGARLSGGQAQRLALARAFLKDAPLLLMDEPTSQLDPITESQLAEATRRLMAGKTVITIAHRLNTVFQADRILVLRDGTIAAAGRHSELMESSPLYRDLVRAYTGFDKLQNLDLAEIASLDEDQHRPPARSSRASLVHLDPGQESSPPGGVIRRLLAFFKPYLREVLASALLGTLTIASSIGLMGASAWLIVTAATHPNIAVLQVAIVGVRFFGISRGVSRYGERLVSHNLTFKILTELRVWFYNSLIPLAPARTSRYRAGDLLSRITSDVTSLEDFYVRALAPPLVAILVGLGTGAFLYHYQPVLALLLGSAFILGGLLVPLAVRRLAQEPGQALVRSRATLAGQLVSYVQGLPDLLVYGQAGSKREEMDRIRRSYSRAELKLACIRGMNTGLLVLISNLGMWLALILAIPQVRAGQIPGEMLAALALIVLSAFEAVQPLPQAMETLSSSGEAGSRLMEILDAEPAVIDPADPAPLPSGVSIQVSGLAFRYPGSEGYALDGIDFQLQEGELLAVVGPSGSGKSTLANLLLRFWGNYLGRISLGGESTSLADLSQQELRERISAVPQNPELFQYTLESNIRLGLPGATREQVAAAAHWSKLDDLIAQLPDGLDTWLGERGQRFSAGEGQRIAVARAVLKDAPLLILDEPTANLDPATERGLMENLLQLLKGKTTLLITHRLVGLGQADRILVLDGGRITEQGTEDELLDQGGLYRSMWLSQNRILSYS